MPRTRTSGQKADRAGPPAPHAGGPDRPSARGQAAPNGPASSLPASPAARRGARLALVVFVAALAVRLAFLADIADSPTFRLPVVDGLTYHQAARSLAEGRGFTERFFFQPFLYPLFLAGVYWPTAASIVAAKVAQALLGSLTCVLVFHLGRKLFDTPTALLAAGITILYGPLLFFESELVAAGLAALFAVALVLVFLRAAETRSPAMFAAAGLMGALAVHARPTFLPFFAAGCLWLALTVLGRKAGQPRRSCPFALAAALTLLGFGLPMLAVACANQKTTGHFAFLPSSGGLNFYLGNNADYDRTVNIRPGHKWVDVMELPVRHGAARDAQAAQRFYYDQTFHFVRGQPLAFAALLGQKALQFASSRETPRNVDPYLFRRWSAMLRVLMWKIGPFGFPFGLLLPLAVVALVLRPGRMPPVLLLGVTLLPAAIIVVLVSGRYRIPIIPLLAVMAAAGVTGLLEAVKARRWKRLALAVAAATATVLIATLPGPFVSERMDYAAELHFELCDPLDDAGRLDDAIAQCRKAIDLQPDYADAVATMGLLMEKKGRPEEAAEYYRRALATDPTLGRARINLGNILVTRGDLDGAMDQYRQALADRPFDETVCTNISVVLDRKNQGDQAMQYAQRALELNADYAPAQNQMGWVLEKASRNAEALQHYARAAALDPNGTTLTNLGNLYAKMGQYRQAVAQYQASLKYLPQNAYVHCYLARALVQLGQAEQAIGHYRRALFYRPAFVQARQELDELLQAGSTLPAGPGG